MDNITFKMSNKKFNSIIEEYIYYQKYATKYYGDKTITLMEVGSFFEAYQTNDDGYDLKEISILLNIIVTKKNKNIENINIKNPLMLGFPSIVLYKYTNILLENNYTIILINQINNDGKISRKISEILTPGTTLCNYKSDEIYIACVYIEIIYNYKLLQNINIITLCYLDVSTGKNYIFEFNKDNEYNIEELYKITSSYNFKELLFVCDKKIINDDIIEKIIKKLKNYINNVKIYNCDKIKDMYNKNIFTLNYQEQFLKKVFYNIPQINICYSLGIENMNFARNSYIILLNYVYQLNPKYLEISQPKILFESKFLYLGNNALQQLNVLSDTNCKNKSLFDIINYTSTAMGKRFLKNKLINPYCDVDEIKKINDIIDCICNEDINDIKLYLEKLNDVERLIHKISLDKCNPKDISIIYENLITIKNIFLCLKNKKLFYEKLISFIDIKNNFIFIDDITDILNYLEKYLNIAECNKYNLFNDINTIIFNNKNDIKNLNNMFNSLQINEKGIEEIRDYFEKILIQDKQNIDDNNSKKKMVENIKIKYNVKEGHYFMTTKRKYEILESKLPNDIFININNINIHFEKNMLDIKELKSNNIKIYLTFLKEKSNEREEILKIFRKESEKYFKDIIETFFKKYKNTIYSIIKHITIIDYLICGAICAFKNNYVKPEIIYDINKSFIDVKELRHPIIEKLDKIMYKPFDIQLGKDYNGILLFGLNSAGKCFHENTKIKLFNNEWIYAKDIKVGDILMGDDFNKRIVLNVNKGNNLLYDIIPDDFFDSFKITLNHILCLVKNSKFINMTLYSYFLLDNKEEYQLYGFKKNNIIVKSNFKVIYFGNSNYVGFQVDDNQKIQLYDGLVTHNSTLQKSIGLNIILAQIGYYVAATEFKYHPYESLITRISGNDNIYDGLSSFMVELYELKNILKRSNNKTLVIADEVSRGTEHNSGLIIVSTMIKILLKNNTSFITASHLHKITDIINDNKLKIKHIHIEIENNKNNDISKINFIRELRDGCGPLFYGFDIAKIILDNHDFIEEAEYINSLYFNKDFIGKKQSKYNKKLFINKCDICNFYPNINEKPLETHHINFQKNSLKNGYLNNKIYQHKNNLFNLCVLCESCHNDLHSNKLIIYGYEETSKGFFLNYKYIKNNEL